MKRLVFIGLCTLVLVNASASAQSDAYVDASIDAGQGANQDAVLDASADAASEVGLVRNELPLPDGHQPVIHLTLIPNEAVLLGEIVRLKLEVQLPDGDDVNLERPRFEGLEIHAQRHRESLNANQRTFVFELDLLAFALGEIRIEPMTLRVVTESGQVGLAHTQEAVVHVRGRTSNEAQPEAKPLSTPVQVYEDDMRLVYLAGALLLIALGMLLGKWIRRWWQKRPKPALPPPPRRPAWELAQEKLDRLRISQNEYFESGRQAEFVDEVSDALREYLGMRFGFNGLESTSDEILARLRKERLMAITLPEITELLSESDFVKFAKFKPENEHCVGLLAAALRIVRGTIPAAVMHQLHDGPSANGHQPANGPRPGSGGQR